jgi:GNAT superfamily N-acetyltransferase
MEFHPVTPDRWRDLEKLFRGHGAPGYCWCTYWRIPASEYSRLDSPGRKQVLKETVDSGVPTGILAYMDGDSVGWCSVAPRETYTRLERSKTIPASAAPRTWAITCFFVLRSARRKGLMLDLISAALDYAKSKGALFVEAYPAVPGVKEDGEPDYQVSYRFMGFASTFEKAGFQEVSQSGSKRPVFRYSLEGAE